jgi:hypothetical protein
MIVDVIGFKQSDGTWNSGAYGDKRLAEVRADKLLWYRQALIEFNNNILAHFSVARGAEERLREHAKKKKELTPMSQSKYKIDSSSKPKKDPYGWDSAYSKGGIVG